MFTVGRGYDIFNIVEDLFEKTDRTFNDISFNYPAIATTLLGTKVLSEVIFGDVCSLDLPPPPTTTTTTATTAMPTRSGRHLTLSSHSILDKNDGKMEFLEENGARLFDYVLDPSRLYISFGQAAVAYSWHIPYCLLKVIFTSK